MTRAVESKQGAGEGGQLFWMQMLYAEWCGGSGGRSGGVEVVGGADMGCGRDGERSCSGCRCSILNGVGLWG